MLYNFGNYSHW